MQVHMAFRVRSVDEFVSRVTELHVIYVNLKREAGQIAMWPDGVKQVYLQDPDGYWIEVNEAKY
jgi:lactoylglutathione lyase